MQIPTLSSLNKTRIILMRVFRLLKFVLLFLCIQANAKGNAQQITFEGKDVALTKIFSVIKEQTGFVTLYTEDLLTASKPVTVSASKMLLPAFLDMILKGQNLNYLLTDKTIILSRRNITSNKNAGDFPAKIISAPVTGIVLGKDGPVNGASVMLKPLDIGMATNEKGEFQFSSVPEGNYVLEVTSVGYKKYTQKIAVRAEKLELKIVLELNIKVQDSVSVSTGYSIKKVGEITGAIQKISGDVLRKSLTNSDPASLLKGRTTGLYISEQNAGDPTSAAQIFVRGQSSIAGVGIDQFNEFVLPALNYGPLIVLDGVIMPNQNLKDLVTVQEIQDITILKDAAATAVYGSRAAGGVLVVTTKRGRDTKPLINVEVKYGINQPNQGTIHYLNGEELYDRQKQFYTEDYKQNNGSLSPAYPTVEDYLKYKLPAQKDVSNSYNWSKFAYRTTNTQEANISASGGNERAKFYAGGTYYKEQSTAIKNSLTRGTFRINLDSRLTNKLSLNISLNGILNNGRQDPDGGGETLVPWANPFNKDGFITQTLKYKMDGFKNVTDNPLFNMQYDYLSLQSQLFFGSLKLEYKITNWLSISTTNSGNLNYSKDEQYLDARTYSGGGASYSSQGFLGTNTNTLKNYLTSNQLNFNKKFGDHSLRALAAFEFGQTTNEYTLVNVNHVRAGYPVISLASQIGTQYDYLSAAKTGNIEGGKDIKALFSAFSEVGYTYKDRYIVSGSIRTDASSSFGRNNRYGTFYSAGAAWIVSSEKFMHALNWIDNLKLRCSYGTSGSQLGDNFLTQTLYDPRYAYAGQTGAAIAILGNPSLRWEVTKTINTGFDLGLFQRIDLSFDIYNRLSENLLQKITLPSLSGFPSQWQNVASVQNNGIEFLINSKNIVRKNFRWSTSFNFSYNKNKILSVANDSLKQGFLSGSYFLFPGDDINTLKAIKYAGVDPQTGKPLFEKLIFDANGHKTGVEYVNTVADAATDSRQFQTVGSFQPKFYGGLTNTITYKQFSLDILITYALKYVVNDLTALYAQGTSVTSGNQIEYRKNQVLWTTPGQTNATEPWFYYQATTDYYESSKYIHDASNASLRSIRLGYDLPGKISKKLNIANCTASVSIDNLYTLYSKSLVASNAEGPSVGEAQDFGNSGSGTGIPRRYVFGLVITF